MKINEAMISIPPYISTPWANISTLYMKGNLLVVILKEGDVIHIPGLKQEVVEVIFNAHAAFIDKQTMDKQEAPKQNLPIHHQHMQEIPFKIGFASFDGIGAAMQHNPAQANMPNLPLEILAKIGSIAKVLAPDETFLPKAEPHCNCPHCQIARAISQEPQVQATIMIEPEEEVVSEQDLTFQQWEIHQEGDKLFNVINKLDTNERYSVFLGEPVGCTCGKQGCEHILAVLKS